MLGTIMQHIQRDLGDLIEDDVLNQVLGDYISASYVPFDRRKDTFL